MADHLHKQIRAAVANKLTGLITSGTRVYVNRLAPLPDDTPPALLIELNEERVSGVTMGSPQLMECELSLSVIAAAKATSALDDTLDQMSKEVQIALASGITVAGRTLDVFYTGMGFEDAQSNKPAAVKRMTFTIPYAAMSNVPDALS